MRPPTKQVLDLHDEETPFLYPLPPFRRNYYCFRSEGDKNLAPPLYLKKRPTGYAPPSTKPIEDASLLGLPYELFHRIARSDVKTCGLLRMSGFALRETKNDRKQWAYEERRRLRGASNDCTENDIRNAANKMMYAYTHLPARKCNFWFDTFDLKDAPWVRRAFEQVAYKIAFCGLKRHAEAIPYDQDSMVGKLVKCASIMRIAPTGVWRCRIAECVIKNKPVILVADSELHMLQSDMFQHLYIRNGRRPISPERFRFENYIDSEGKSSDRFVTQKLREVKIINTSGSVVDVH